MQECTLCCLSYRALGPKLISVSPSTQAAAPTTTCPCPCPRPWSPPDEIDAIGTKRYDAHSGGEREIQRTMLELLNQLDGFDSMSEVKVGGASGGLNPRADLEGDGTERARKVRMQGLHAGPELPCTTVHSPASAVLTLAHGP